MYFIYLLKPDAGDVQSCLHKTREADFNYDAKWRGVTRICPLPLSDLREDGFAINRTRVQVGSGRPAFDRARDFVTQWGHFQLGWADVDARTPVRPGARLVVRAKSLLLWTLNPLEIVYVESRGHASPADTPPLKERNVIRSVSHSDDSDKWRQRRSVAGGGRTHRLRRGGRVGPEGVLDLGTGGGGVEEGKAPGGRFAFAHGTLGGHFLAGEERFAVEWDAEDDSVWYEVLSFSKPSNVLAQATYPIVRMLQAQFARDSTRRVVEAVGRV